MCKGFRSTPSFRKFRSEGHRSKGHQSSHQAQVQAFRTAFIQIDAEEVLHSSEDFGVTT